MPSNKLPETSAINTSSSLQPRQYAALQALGIDIFQPVREFVVSELAWLEDLCKLLNIDKSACIFDSKEVFFDEPNKQLHLPATIMVDEAQFKKRIWQSIRQFLT